MSDAKEDEGPGVEENAEGQGEEGKKKGGNLKALLPVLLRFVAIGLAALVFIVTVSVVTYMLLNKRGQAQTVVPENSPYQGTRLQYSMFTAIGQIRTTTTDEIPSSVVVDMIIGYDLNDNAAATELTGRLYELRDFVRSYFRSKTAAELQPDNEGRIKKEIVELLNTRYLDTARARIILFNQLDVMTTQ